MITNGGGPINASDIGDLAFVKPTPGGGRTFTELQATGTVVPEPATFIMFGILGIIGVIKKRFF